MEKTKKVIVIIEDEKYKFDGIKGDLERALGAGYTYISRGQGDGIQLAAEDLIALLKGADAVLCDYWLGDKSTLTRDGKQIDIDIRGLTGLESLMHAASIMHNDSSIISNYQGNQVLQIENLFSFPVIGISTAFDKGQRDIIGKHQQIGMPQENMIGKENRQKLAQRLKNIFKTKKK